MKWFIESADRHQATLLPECLEEVQRRLDENPQAMRTRRETVEHPFNHQCPNGGDALLDEAAQERGHRNGSTRACLQSDSSDEYRGHQAAHRSNQGMIADENTSCDNRIRLIHPPERSRGKPERNIRQIG